MWSEECVKCRVWWSVVERGRVWWSVGCRVWSVEECKVSSAKSRVWSVKCGVRSLKCKLWSVECKV